MHKVFYLSFRPKEEVLTTERSKSPANINISLVIARNDAPFIFRLLPFARKTLSLNFFSYSKTL